MKKAFNLEPDFTVGAAVYATHQGNYYKQVVSPDFNEITEDEYNTARAACDKIEGTSKWKPRTHLEAIVDDTLEDGLVHLDSTIDGIASQVLNNALSLCTNEPYLKITEKEGRKEYSLDFKFNDKTSMSILLGVAQ